MKRLSGRITQLPELFHKMCMSTAFIHRRLYLWWYSIATRCLVDVCVLQHEWMLAQFWAYILLAFKHIQYSFLSRTFNQHHNNPLLPCVDLCNLFPLQSSAILCNPPWFFHHHHHLSLRSSAVIFPYSTPQSFHCPAKPSATMGCGQSRPSYNERAQSARPKKVFVRSRSSGQVYVEGRGNNNGRKNSKGKNKRRHH